MIYSPFVNFKMKIILAISLLFNCVCFCSRPFYSADMCRKREDNDCSFQLPNADTGKCLIYSTMVCKRYDFSSWNLDSLTVPVLESDIPLNIAIVPYAASPTPLLEKDPVSAINITMTVLRKDIKGFSFLLTEERNRALGSQKNICRIFDFRNYTWDFETSVMLYYDCLHYLVENGTQNVTLTFQIYPQNIKLTYLVSIPPTPLEYYDSPCSWKPLVMIFQGGLQTYYIQVKFSNTPDNVDIPFYVVTLLDINNIEMKSIKLFSDNGTNMLSTEFVSDDEGYFYISISIVDANETPCVIAKSRPFFVGYQPEDYSLVTFIILLSVMFIFASVLLYIVFQRHCTTVKPPFLKLLFVYSFDCPQHKEFLLAYIKFMEKNYNFKIHTIYGNGGNPNTWIEEKYFDSDVIVFVISEGVFHTFERNNIPPLVEDHWEGQLPAAEKFICEQKFVRTYSDDRNERVKKFCKICFSYSGKQHVPKCLKHKGNLFMFPKDENKFLCFILGCPKILFCREHHKKKFLNDQDVKKKLEIMKETVSKKMHISYRENAGKGNISGAMESLNKIDTCVKTHQCSSGDFLKSVIKEKCKENIELSAHKSDLKNEDPVRYLIHEELHKNKIKD